MADMIWQLVEAAVVADHEDMVAGDGAEGLVLHRRFVAEATRRSAAQAGTSTALVKAPKDR